MDKLTLFTYGTLKRGLRFHYFLENAQFIRETTIPYFELYNYGFYPFAIKTKTQDKLIQAEIYEINESTLLQLDHLEGYPTLFTRSVVLDSNGIEGWIYHADVKRAENIKKEYPLIESGNWIN